MRKVKHDFQVANQEISFGNVILLRYFSIPYLFLTKIAVQKKSKMLISIEKSVETG